MPLDLKTLSNLERKLLVDDGVKGIETRLAGIMWSWLLRLVVVDAASVDVADVEAGEGAVKVFEEDGPRDVEEPA